MKTKKILSFKLKNPRKGTETGENAFVVFVETIDFQIKESPEGD